MAKIIKLTQEYLEEVRRDFEESLNNVKLADGKISFSKTFGSIDCKATVYFTELAWQKMQTLIREFDKEVAWHGVAYRGEDPDKNEYTITDILVYPQEVTGVTVSTDQVEYQTWLMSHDDEVFNNIRMQGHSHVNMGTTPSTVDLNLYERFLDQLDDTMFYIFLIYNKRGEKTYKIYDLAKNILFETADVTVKVLGNGFDMDEFMKDAKSKVVSKTYPTYNGGYYKTPATPAASAASAVPVKPAAQAPALPKKESKGEVTPVTGIRKGKRPAKQVGGYSKYDDDYDLYGYDDSPYGAFGYREGRWH